MFKSRAFVSLAAGLSLAGGMSVPSAQAAVVNVPFNLVIEDAQGAPSEIEYNLDVDGDALVDVDFFINGSFGVSARGGTGGGSSNSQILRNNTAEPVVRNLAPGATVDTSQITGGFNFESAGFGRVYFLGGPAEMEFLDGVAGYMGLQFNNGSGSHFGWLKILVERDGVRVGIEPNDDPGVRLTIIEGAYESTPGVGIQIPAVPEPASLGLLAAGLLMSLRRRVA